MFRIRKIKGYLYFKKHQLLLCLVLLVCLFFLWKKYKNEENRPVVCGSVTDFCGNTVFCVKEANASLLIMSRVPGVSAAYTYVAGPDLTVIYRHFAYEDDELKESLKTYKMRPDRIAVVNPDGQFIELIAPSNLGDKLVALVGQPESRRSYLKCLLKCLSYHESTKLKEFLGDYVEVTVSQLKQRQQKPHGDPPER